MGLSTPVNGPPATEPKAGDNSNDIFGYFMSEGSTANGKPTTSVPSSVTTNNPTKESSETTLAQQEHDFFNQVPNEKEKAKMTKDSILALYGAAPSIPASNQFTMPGMPSVDNGSLFGMFQQQAAPATQQQPSFGIPAVAGNQPSATLNNFAQFGMMQQAQAPMNFQATHTMPNQSMGFSNVPQMNPSMQAFNQPAVTKTNTFATANHTPNNVNNVNQQFGNLNLGNVWQ